MNLTTDKTTNRDFFARVKQAGLQVSAEKVVFELKNCAVVIAGELGDETEITGAHRYSYEVILGSIGLQIGLVELSLVNGELDASSKHLVTTAQQVLLKVKPVIELENG